jgi:hypothetical protein
MAASTLIPPPPNFISRPYRGVSVQELDVPLREEALREFLLGRRIYRRTEFLIAVAGEERAIVQLGKEHEDELFVPATEVRLLAGPDEVVFLRDEGVDCGNANQMARAALASGRDGKVFVVEGRFQHVNLIVEPQPVRVRVVEVVPPEPAKLLDMARTVVDYDEDLPPVELEPALIDLRELAAGAPAGDLMFPCRCARLDLGRRVEFLDSGPQQIGEWTLVGCKRSGQIHADLYGRGPRARIEMCPLELSADRAPTLTKCCLRERGIERDGERVIVPWGSSLEEVRIALHMLTGGPRAAAA